MKLFFPALILIGISTLVLLPGCGFTPPGTVQLKDKPEKYLDRMEISNIDWRAYLFWLEDEYGEDSEKYLQAIPDSNSWLQAYEEPVLWNRDYNHYPIVGITYEQAQAFCQWRSEPVQMKFKKEVQYRLPTVEELKLASEKEDFEQKEDLYAYGTRNWFQRRLDLPRKHKGLFDNAVELTAEQGVAVHGDEETQTLTTQEYVVPQKDLGFRCIAEYAE